MEKLDRNSRFVDEVDDLLYTIREECLLQRSPCRDLSYRNLVVVLFVCFFFLASSEYWRVGRYVNLHAQGSYPGRSHETEVSVR